MIDVRLHAMTMFSLTMDYQCKTLVL